MLRQLNKNLSRILIRHQSSLNKIPKNEPIYSYLVGSDERNNLKKQLEKYSCQVSEIPIVIGDEEIFTNNIRHQKMPFNHSSNLAKFSYADEKLLKHAIDVGEDARHEWELVPLKERCEILRRAADLVSGKYRQQLNAATMLGQGKTAIQAEIDASCELADFFRFNADFAENASTYMPIHTEESKNFMELRGLEGFVAAISPFNFTAIGGNLAATPAMMGCAVMWKPSDTAVLSNYIVYQLLREAGIPSGVINFVPCNGPIFGKSVTQHRHLSAINFTGSIPTFKWLWQQVSQHLDIYANFPVMIGELGGKNFHYVDKSVKDLDNIVYGTIRSAFEYSGQKCSACSRMYLPVSMWNSYVRDKMIEVTKSLKIDSPIAFDTFTSAVIDEAAFDRISNYVEHGKKNCKLIVGGECNKETGYFIKPTIIETTDPRDKIMTQEIFGPVLSVYPYPDNASHIDIMNLIDTSTNYALTGSVYSEEEKVIDDAKKILRHTVGNFYINDKSTGSVVGQQPFGGARLSGTNDKAGGPNYPLRFASPLSTKRTITPLTTHEYGYMEEA
ncbi:hypothetical protein SNEBB_000476 [Seison nebaliae]|nr:hypothetical protein SNEBB_000476 [Seison nebaliae]